VELNRLGGVNARYAAVAVGLALLVGGCVSAAVAYKLGLGTGVDPVYVPAPDPMLVLVENYQMPSAGAQDSETLAVLVSEQLVQHTLVPIIPCDVVADLRAQNPTEYRHMSIASIGKRFGAKQVLYVDVVAMALGPTPGSERIKGQMATLVKIVDTQTGETRWPTDTSQGYPVAYETPLPKTGDASNEPLIQQRVVLGTAIEIGRLFRKWQPDEVTGLED
jgi:hypothetical protein